MRTLNAKHCVAFEREGAEAGELLQKVKDLNAKLGIAVIRDRARQSRRGQLLFCTKSNQNDVLYSTCKHLR